VNVKRPIAGVYENTIDILNQVHPVNMSDRGRLLLDYPVVTDISAKATDMPKGRLLRCNNNGAVLTGKNFVKFSDFVLRTLIIADDFDTGVINFDRIVDAAVLQIINDNFETAIEWTDSIGLTVFGLWRYNGVYFVPFKGQFMYIKSYTDHVDITLNVYGFYK